MLLSGVGTLETDVTKPLSAEKKLKMLDGGPQTRGTVTMTMRMEASSRPCGGHLSTAAAATSAA